MDRCSFFCLIFASTVHFSAVAALDLGGEIEIVPLGPPTHLNYSLFHPVVQKREDTALIGHLDAQIIFKDIEGQTLSQILSPLGRGEADCLKDGGKGTCPLSPRRLDVANFERICTVEFKITDATGPLGELERSFGGCRSDEDEAENYDLFFYPKVKLTKIKRKSSPYKRPDLLELQVQLRKKGLAFPHEEAWVALVAVDATMKPIYSESFVAFPSDFATQDQASTIKKNLHPWVWKRACGFLLAVDYPARLRESNRGNNEKFIEFDSCLPKEGVREVDLAPGLRHSGDTIEIDLFNLGDRKSSSPFFYRYRSFNGRGETIRV